MTTRKKSVRQAAGELLAGAGNLGTETRVFDDNEVRQLLRAAVERAGTQVAFANRHRLDRTHLNQVLKGKSRISKSLLKCLGLRKAYIFDHTANPSKTADAHSLAPALEHVDASIT